MRSNKLFSSLVRAEPKAILRIIQLTPNQLRNHAGINFLIGRSIVHENLALAILEEKGILIIFLGATEICPHVKKVKLRRHKG